MITSLEKLFGICFHKYQLQKTEVDDDSFKLSGITISRNKGENE